jgi:hypothetical protein
MPELWQRAARMNCPICLEPTEIEHPLGVCVSNIRRQEREAVVRFLRNCPAEFQLTRAAMAATADLIEEGIHLDTGLVSGGGGEG